MQIFTYYFQKSKEKMNGLQREEEREIKKGSLCLQM